MRDFVNEAQLPIIAAGIQDAQNVVTSDPQLGNRFRDVTTLPRWDVTAEFLAFLGRYEAGLPLRRASGLADEALATRVLALEEGTLGEALALLADAAMAAVDGGEEQITLRIIDRLGWVPPSRRGRPAARHA